MRKAASCGGLAFLDPDEEALVVIRSPAAAKDKKKGSFSKLRCEQPISANDEPHNFASDCRKVVWMDALNAGPTAAVLAAAFVFFSLLSYFLDQYVVTAKQSIAVFLVGSYVVFSSYFTFHFYLEKYSESYRNVESDKQFYVLSNLLKSATLLSYTPLAAAVLWSTMVDDHWDTIRIRNLGTLYCIPDFVSLFLVKKMSKTTICHHIAVCVFNAVSMANDYSQDNVCRLIMVYAVFSTFAYLVNLLLASRFLGIPKWLARILSAAALLIYAGCCSVNWAWQCVQIKKLLWNGHTWPVYSFIALIILVVYDDLVLMKWLWYKATQGAQKARLMEKKKDN